MYDAGVCKHILRKKRGVKNTPLFLYRYIISLIRLGDLPLLFFGNKGYYQRCADG